mmetsp:Transcript_4122/g.8986  ORF Transcript_4122/g.8986 Transcript_4122/m.8986 type:complete len:391 (-) Transcript_4122:1222-2394(-)|eukprot:CAMPEP_0202922822 /NCGR_PEP_ID=MMETSP1392-20130828/78128_1 /ASSEMBLY_ACC=CAM_ASM_000868 /TAXON_ID=225041 /ORGANISM="Chlamydomonas chlamydogama, Strain SAG 11-48b" /LENGTH=390 /DNA_ID=CAMNT_0049616471 /DNA_START=198 /DNA_END=1370 /DNA_ORIENTATION=+
MVRQFKVILDKDAYHPGDVVTGTCLEIEANIMLKCTLKEETKESVYVQEKPTNSRQSKEFWKFSMFACNEDPSKPAHLGTPFSFKLPEFLPPSCEFSCRLDNQPSEVTASLSYMLQAESDMLGAGQAVLRVLPRWPLPSRLHPEPYRACLELSGGRGMLACLNPHQAVDLTVTSTTWDMDIDSPSTVDLKIQVNNKTRQALSAINIQLQERWIMLKTSPPQNRLRWAPLVSSTHKVSIPPGATSDLDLLVDVPVLSACAPSMVPPFKGKLFCVQHVWAISVELEGRSGGCLGGRTQRYGAEEGKGSVCYRPVHLYSSQQLAAAKANASSEQQHKAGMELGQADGVPELQQHLVKEVTSGPGAQAGQVRTAVITAVACDQVQVSGPSQSSM